MSFFRLLPPNREINTAYVMRLLNCVLVISAKHHRTASGAPLNMERKKRGKETWKWKNYIFHVAQVCKCISFFWVFLLVNSTRRKEVLKMLWSESEILFRVNQNLTKPYLSLACWTDSIPWIYWAQTQTLKINPVEIVKGKRILTYGVTCANTVEK